jgi:hypothetical protein
MDLLNVGILPQHYTVSQPRRWRQHGRLKRWYPTIQLHGVTAQKDLDLEHHRREGLKTRTRILNYIPVSKTFPVLCVVGHTLNMQIDSIIERVALVCFHYYEYGGCTAPESAKLKVTLFLCLTKYHAMNTYWRWGGIAPRISNLGTGLRTVLILTP